MTASLIKAVVIQELFAFLSEAKGSAGSVIVERFSQVTEL